MKDIELEVIPKIEQLLEGMKWEQKQRVLNFIRERAEFDPVTDGGGQQLLGGLTK